MSYVFVGKVHSPQGIKGEVFVSIYSGEAEWVESWDTLYVSKEGEEKPDKEFKIESIREHQKKGRWGFSVRLKGVSDRDGSEAMKGLRVYVPEDFFITEAEDEDFYLREVLGFKVMDKTRGEVGKVVGFSGNDFQDIIVVEGGKGEFEVPFTEPLLIETDKQNKQLIMDIPQGLVAGEEL